MQPLIAARHAEIGEICRRFHVRRLDVFGSAARDDFDPAHSDLDLLALFEPMPPAAYAQA
jgi:predicted nucleotidyltransferase